MPQKITEIKNVLDHVRQFKLSGEKIILAGGCFDILHIGHLKFLEEAKQLGGKLLVMLESDEKVSKLKGPDRPVFSQNDRADALAHLSHVDLIIKLPYFSTDDQYAKLVTDISPEVIAVTENDPNLKKKKEQAHKLGGRIEEIKFVKSLSSSRLAEILKKEKHF